MEYFRFMLSLCEGDCVMLNLYLTLGELSCEEFNFLPYFNIVFEFRTLINPHLSLKKPEKLFRSGLFDVLSRPLNYPKILFLPSIKDKNKLLADIK